MARTIGGYVEGLGQAAHSVIRRSGRAVLRSFGTVADAVQRDAQAARRLGIEECGDDTAALDGHAVNSGLWRPRHARDGASFSNTELRALVLRERWTWHAKAGTDDAIIDWLAMLGWTATIHSYTTLAQAGAVNAFGGHVGFFYVEIAAPSYFLPPAEWDGGDEWDGGILWNLTEPYEGAIGDLRRAIRKWRTPGTSCRFLRIAIDGTDPQEWVHIPVGESWEFDDSGDPIAGAGLYLDGY